MDTRTPTKNNIPARPSRASSGPGTIHDDGMVLNNELDYLDVYCQLNPVDKSVRVQVFQANPDQSSDRIDSHHPDATDSQRGGTLKRLNRSIVSVKPGTGTVSKNDGANAFDGSEVDALERRDPTQNSGPKNFQFVIHIDVGEGQHSVEQPADISVSTVHDKTVTPALDTSLARAVEAKTPPPTPKEGPVTPPAAQLTLDSTIEFQEFRAEHNCLASDGKRNELLIFNSALKKLIILQHETDGRCHRRSYIQWPATLSPKISDVTYWAENSHYILSTTATNYLYLFDRANEFFYPVQLANGSKVSRVHCYDRFVYCILDNNLLVRYRWDEQGASLTDMRTIDISGSSHGSSHRGKRLLDVTCDSEQLIVVYAAGGDNNNDSIRLACLDPGQLRVNEDFELDAAGHINRNYIRIESTETFLSEPRLTEGNRDMAETERRRLPGRFLYSNGEHRRVKHIDLTKHGKERVTTLTLPSFKPVNACLLFDGRFVIMRDDPHQLMIYKKESVRS